MAKSQSKQSEAHRPSGPGTKYKPTSSPPLQSADIPSKTIQNPSGQEQSHNRGKI